MMNFDIDSRSVLKRALKNGGEYADLFIERSTPFSIMCESGRVEKVLSGLDCGAGVRLIFGQRTAYAYSNDISLPALIALADAVSQAVVGAVSASPNAVMNLTRKNPRVDFRIEKAPEAVSTDQKVGMVLQADRIARSVDSRIRQVMVVYRENRQQVLIANSDGSLAEDERRHLTALVHVVAADG